MADYFEAVPGQSFDTHRQWVNRASSWLTSHERYRNTEHAKGKGWQGEHFTALCFDQKGRRCRNGGDFQRAHDEGAFPVWWVWPDQIADLLMAGRKLPALDGAAMEWAAVHAALLNLAETIALMEGRDMHDTEALDAGEGYDLAIRKVVDLIRAMAGE